MALSLEEVERLTLLIEECSEVAQAVTKIIRYGYQVSHPSGEYNNRDQLERELGDVMGIIRLLTENGDVDYTRVAKYSVEKMRRLPEWLRYTHKIPL
jgi:NTP pyrophosphatase (non-canonical NTP hydrolase)